MKVLRWLFAVAVLSGCGCQQQDSQMKWKDVCNKLRGQGYASLNETEEVWVNTVGLIGSVNNGGLVSFFYNSYAERYDETVDALGELEAYEVLELVEAYGEFFGDEVPFDIGERNRIINSWESTGPTARACDEIEEAILPLMNPLQEKIDRYVSEHGYDPDYGV